MIIAMLLDYSCFLAYSEFYSYVSFLMQRFAITKTLTLLLISPHLHGDATARPESVS